MASKDLEDFSPSQWRYRPRRKIVKPCLDYSQMLLREEEQALKRALYVSLRDTKSGNDGSSFSAKKNTEDINESSIATISSTNDNRSSGQLKKRRCVKSLELLNIPQKQSELPLPDSRQVNYEDSGCAATSPSSSDPFGRSLYQGIGASSDLKRQDISIVGSISKRTRRQLKVQRKFAHLQPYSPNCLLVQKLGSSSSSRPKTEDFIRFLCLRGTASLPKELEFFNSPILPRSPLSSDDDEYLPVSPFFKRQVDGSSTIHKSNLYSSYPHQLEHDFSDTFTSDESSIFKEDQSPKNILSNATYGIDNGHSSWLPTRFVNASNFPSNMDDIDEGAYDHTKDSIDTKFKHLITDKEDVRNEDFDGLSELSLNILTCLERGSSASGSSTHISVLERDEKKGEFDLRSTAFSSRGSKADAITPEALISIVGNVSNSSEESDQERPISSCMYLTGSPSIKADSTTSACRTGAQSRNKVKGNKADAKIFEAELETAPTFRPMEQEFKDPMKYIRKIAPFVMKYGMCILVPPAGWQPSSNISDDIRFGTRIQHIHRMRNRNPETTKFLTCLHRCLGETSDLLEAMPQIGSCEVDLLDMSRAFQSVGGVAKVNTPRKWHRIADTLHIPKGAQGRINKLQDIYYKYVLPFDILSNEEKERIKQEVDQDPIGFLSQDPESKGRSASVASFHRIASNAQELYGRGQTNTCALEEDFWNSVTVGKRHVAALSGDIDTMNCESSFHVGRSKSGWNVSSLPQSQGSLLRYLGVVPGLTTSSLQFSSVFSTSQWQKHDDNLFRIEYLHAGASRIWYAVPSHVENAFHRKAASLLPELTFSGDEAQKFLISPLDLISESCRISRAVQNEGQFVLCLPNVYHCVFSCGYCLTESCYFAHIDWLKARLDKGASIIKPTRTFPAEMIILNYAKSVVQKSKRSDNIALVLQLAEKIRTATHSSEHRLSIAGVQKSSDVPHAQNKRFAVDWDVCSCCGRPLYPLVIWRDSYFYCADHALVALDQISGDINDCFKMFRYWEDEELNDLISGLEKLLKIKESL